MAEETVFSKIIRGELPCTKVYEDDLVLAFMDIMPVNPGHTLVIPKVPAQEIGDLDEDTGTHLFRIGMRVERALRQADIRCEGVNFLINNGRAAFQEVMHVHLHVIPRYEGDGMRLHFGQRRAETDQLEATAEMIRAHL